MQVQGTQVRKTMSTSTLTGDKVVNRQDEDLGEIKDFMVDLDSGCIAYAVLSYGGFLGMGDKLFAVPMQALALDEDRKVFVFDVSKDRLQDAPSFDKDNWPESSDTQFIDRVYDYYGYQAGWRSSEFSQSRRGPM
jgi:sporulation protein YlmC with PRC-barrel domain